MTGRLGQHETCASRMLKHQLPTSKLQGSFKFQASASKPFAAGNATKAERRVEGSELRATNFYLRCETVRGVGPHKWLAVRRRNEQSQRRGSSNTLTMKKFVLGLVTAIAGAAFISSCSNKHETESTTHHSTSAATKKTTTGSATSTTKKTGTSGSSSSTSTSTKKSASPTASPSKKSEESSSSSSPSPSPTESPTPSE